MTTDGFTNAVAIGAVTSPLWLQEASSVVSDVLPILGAVWLIVQIAHKLHTWTSEDRND